MIKVMLTVAGPAELAERLAQLAKQGTEVTLATPFGMFSAGIGGDDMVFRAAEQLLLNYMPELRGDGEPTSRETVRYHLRCAADHAYRDRHS